MTIDDLFRRFEEDRAWEQDEERRIQVVRAERERVRAWIEAQREEAARVEAERSYEAEL